MSGGIAALLGAEADAVDQFIRVLLAEQDALTRGDVDALAAVTTQKNELAERLNGMDKERNAVIQRAGYSGDRQGMRSWLAANRQDRAAAQAWVRLMKAATEARELNRLNGEIIVMRLQATSQALATLNHQAKRSALYGPDGQTAQLTGSRIIDAA